MPSVSSRPDPPRRYVDSFPVENLIPHPQNPRRGNTSLIVRSMEANGFFGTVLAQESSGIIIAGEHRWRAALSNNKETIPVLFLDIDDDWAMDIRLADNSTNDASNYDETVLLPLLNSIVARRGDDGLLATGFTSEDMDFLVQNAATAPARASEIVVDRMLDSFIGTGDVPNDIFAANHSLGSITSSGYAAPAATQSGQSDDSPDRIEREDSAIGNSIDAPQASVQSAPPSVMNPGDNPTQLLIVLTVSARDAIMRRLREIATTYNVSTTADALQIALGVHARQAELTGGIPATQVVHNAPRTENAPEPPINPPEYTNPGRLGSLANVLSESRIAPAAEPEPQEIVEAAPEAADESTSAQEPTDAPTRRRGRPRRATNESATSAQG